MHIKRFVFKGSDQMAACTRCGFQQIGTQAYCERCGLFLPALAMYEPTAPDSDVVPLPQLPTRPVRKQIVLERTLTARMVAVRFMRECFAFLGLLIATFGLYGSIYDIVGPQIAFCLGILLLVGGTIYMTMRLFVSKSLPRLHSSQRVIGWAIATAMGFVLFLLVPEVPQTTKILMDLGFGTLFFFYGLTLTFLAVC